MAKHRPKRAADAGGHRRPRGGPAPATPAGPPPLPRDPEVLRTLLRHTNEAIEFLEAAGRRQRGLLHDVESIAADPTPSEERQLAVRTTKAESARAFAIGGPPATIVKDYLDPLAFERTVRAHAASLAALRQPLPPGPKAAALAPTHATRLRAVVRTHAAVVGVFEVLRARVIAALERAAAADSRADNARKVPLRLPRNPEVLKLAQHLARCKGEGLLQLEIAVEFTDGDETKAQSLLRQLRRYPHLRQM